MAFGDDDEFFSAVDLDESNAPPEVRYGLVVPERAEVIFSKGEIVRDDLAECEARFRRLGRPRIIFEEEEA
jgi:hypothetical protein